MHSGVRKKHGFVRRATNLDDEWRTSRDYWPQRQSSAVACLSILDFKTKKRSTTERPL
jgi:hypothetical protein